MSQRHLLLTAVLVSFLIFACEDNSADHPIFKYYPPTSVFEEGYVNKYYEHYYPKNTNSSAATRIAYSFYQKTSDSTFMIENYNAGFWLTGTRHYRTNGSKLHVASLMDIWRTDSTHLQIDKSLHSDWSAHEMDNEHYFIRADYDTYSSSYGARQVAQRDSIINDLETKVFVKESRREVIDDDTTVYHWKRTSYYVQDLGYFGMVQEHDEYTWEVELVEQMPVSKFKELANHDEKRVAYIDPEKTLDKGSGFEICGHELFIADYYNSTPDGDYKYGKAALIDTIFSNLDEEKLMNQTGMLTFRFVVNCEGEAGRFIARGYDLNYQPYEFPKETISHLYEQLLKLKKWQPVVFKDGPQDAYFYFTFKLNNGKITDILP